MTAALHWLQCHGVVATPAALAQQAQPSYEYREDGRLVTVVDALQAQPLTDEMIDAGSHRYYDVSASPEELFREGAKWARDRMAQQVQPAGADKCERGCGKRKHVGQACGW